MSDSDFFNEALDALYKAAKASANFIEAALTLKATEFSPADKERLQIALSVLKVTWSDEEDDEEDEDDSFEKYN
ncbi:hypothetical protein NIES4071_107190 (plasmid) [Calothrix sp. NIES-4071]|nr:hypothetical protein NIES4071_107190 [Calothrix sp. NIES-4071]BAZ64759.1 hypothetical protein NIES4105_104920 [Calothrix sp. NIES-4105]